MSQYAPRIITIKVPVDKIGEVIGPKGKMINSIQDDTGAEITIEDDGTIYIGATDGRRPRRPGPRSTRSPTRTCPRSASGSSARW
jgi:polyribonucleotide nucleotidyltransferase